VTGRSLTSRLPIRFPVNFLLIESLRRYHAHYGDEFQVECPDGSRRRRTLGEAMTEVAARLTRLFLADPVGRRPCHAVVLYKSWYTSHLRLDCPSQRINFTID
jgi:hypothetical protein